ncbi:MULTISPECIES: hypothetical protein [unclassified Lysobacter]|uniref:hypothetical protein n=1 Tax=unclassified Lysobacter TaxID=2635362 RepID=UPI001BEB99F6|nr:MULTISPECIES: hypothetical protein [unclassified Lysobacter]MBT2745471.1 hypothetical protein [Lysobacter sp. ISL-42]MBT2777013.1 hypothetical protein [Lysobacter sp. ISL-54]MBT2781533.1 hypothetical protein [Lysobacter sp. ISL-52]
MSQVEETRLLGRKVAVETPVLDVPGNSATFATASTIRRTAPTNEVDFADNGDHIP